MLLNWTGVASGCDPCGDDLPESKLSRVSRPCLLEVLLSVAGSGLAGFTGLGPLTGEGRVGSLCLEGVLAMAICGGSRTRGRAAVLAACWCCSKRRCLPREMALSGFSSKGSLVADSVFTDSMWLLLCLRSFMSLFGEMSGAGGERQCLGSIVAAGVAVGK